MKRILKYFPILLGVLLFCSCASIVSKSTYPITVNTNPSGANVSIKDHNGIEVFKGNSPATVNLKAGKGFFKRAEYVITVSRPGYAEKSVPVTYGVDGWYWGNILLGGVVGMLIVDPATGAMWKLENNIFNIDLSEDVSSADEPLLKVINIADVPQHIKDNMTLLSK